MLLIPQLLKSLNNGDFGFWRLDDNDERWELQKRQKRILAPQRNRENQDTHWIYMFGCVYKVDK